MALPPLVAMGLIRFSLHFLVSHRHRITRCKVSTNASCRSFRGNEPIRRGCVFASCTGALASLEGLVFNMPCKRLVSNVCVNGLRKRRGKQRFISDKYDVSRL